MFNINYDFRLSVECSTLPIINTGTKTKVRLSPSNKVGFICFNESPLNESLGKMLFISS